MKNLSLKNLCPTGRNPPFNLAIVFIVQHETTIYIIYLRYLWNKTNCLNGSPTSLLTRLVTWVVRYCISAVIGYNHYSYTLLQWYSLSVIYFTAVCSGLTLIMGSRFIQSGKIMPSGIIAVLRWVSTSLS